MSPPRGTTPDEFPAIVAYRLAYDCAYAIVERDFDPDARRVLARVLKELPAIAPQLMREAVDDAVAGRNPRW